MGFFVFMSGISHPLRVCWKGVLQKSVKIRCLKHNCILPLAVQKDWELVDKISWFFPCWTSAEPSKMHIFCLDQSEATEMPTIIYRGKFISAGTSITLGDSQTLSLEKRSSPQNWAQPLSFTSSQALLRAKCDALWSVTDHSQHGVLHSRSSSVP